MNTNKLALFAILLWLITLAGFAWFFIRGSTAPGTQERTAIVLNAHERDLILTEMRGLLSAIQGVVDGVGREDRKQIAESARAAGMAAAADANPALLAKLPLPFKTLGMSVHRDMDDIADAAEEGRPAPELLNKVAATLSKCVACHAAWQFKVDDAKE